MSKPSPDVFLSTHQIRYDGIGLKGTPAEIVASLIKLNSTRQLVDGELQDITYRTPDFVGVPVNPATFSPVAVKLENAAVAAYYAAVQTGDLAAVHGAVDRINSVRMIKSGGEFIPQSDFEILAHGKNHVGQTAREIVSERAAIEMGEELPAHSVIPWYDTVEAYQALKEYAEAE